MAVQGLASCPIARTPFVSCHCDKMEAKFRRNAFELDTVIQGFEHSWCEPSDRKVISFQFINMVYYLSRGLNQKIKKELCRNVKLIYCFVWHSRRCHYRWLLPKTLTRIKSGPRVLWWLKTEPDLEQVFNIFSCFLAVSFFFCPRGVADNLWDVNVYNFCCRRLLFWSLFVLKYALIYVIDQALGVCHTIQDAKVERRARPYPVRRLSVQRICPFFVIGLCFVSISRCWVCYTSTLSASRVLARPNGKPRSLPSQLSSSYTLLWAKINKMHHLKASANCLADRETLTVGSIRK